MTKSPDEHEPEWAGAVTGEAGRPLAGAWSYADGQRIWLGTQSRAWRMLAVVPVDPGVSTYEVASRIVALGQEQGECLELANLRDVQLSRVAALLAVTSLLVSHGRRVVCAMRSIKENLSTIPLTRAADGVILCLSLGKTTIAATEEVIAQIGKDRLVGSMLLGRSGGRHVSSARPTGAKLLGAPA